MPYWKEVLMEDGTIRFARTYDARDLRDTWSMKTSLGGVTVSTMFVGSGTAPCYETLVFGPSLPEDEVPLPEVTCETREAAVEGHNRMVRKWKASQQASFLDSVADVVHVNNEYRALDAEGNIIMTLTEDGARKASAYLRMKRETDENL